MSSPQKLVVLMRQITPYWETALAELSQAWSSCGKMEIIAAEVGADPLHPWTTRIPERIGQARLHVVPARRFSRSAAATIWPTAQLHHLLNRLNPDLVIIQEYSPYAVFGGLLWAKARSCPVLVTTDAGPAQRCQFPMWQRAVHFIVNTSVDGVLAKTQDAMSQSTISHLPGLLAPHGVRTDFYEAAASRRPGLRPPYRLIQVGSLIHRKGTDLLLRAFATARKSRPEIELTLVGAGDHEGTRALARALGVEDVVRVMDFVQPAELVRLYQQHDVFVLASRFDTYGVVAHEAAASGLPLVVSRHAGASALLVRDGENGRQVDPENTQDFADALLECLQPDVHARYSRCSSELARQWDARLVAERAALWLRQFRLLHPTRPGALWSAGLARLCRDFFRGLLRGFENLWLPDAFGSLKREVVFLNRYIPFYRDAIFRRVAEWKSVRLIFSGLNLGNLRNVDSVESAAVPATFWGKGSARKIIWLHALPQLWLTRPRLVCTEHSLSLLSTWGLFLLRPLLQFKLVFWTHGLQDYGWKSKKLSPSDRLRLLWLRWADAVIFYSRDRQQDVEEITGPQPRFFVAPNAQDVTALDLWHEELLRESREAVRDRLGMDGLTAIYLGRLSPDKEPLLLADFMSSALPHGITRLEVIGGGELEHALKEACAFLGNRVRFHGPIFDPRRRHELLFAADLLVSPGYVGLNIVDALAAGCPVATRSNMSLWKRHSPEITYVHERFNGVLAPNIPTLAREASRWLASWQDQAACRREEIRQRLRRECSLENQFAGIRQAFTRALESPSGKR